MDRSSYLLNEIAQPIRQSDIFSHFISPSASLVDSEHPLQGDDSYIIHNDLPAHLAQLVRPGKTVFIMGRPGSGKTTIWWVLTYDVTQLDPPLLPVPIDVQTMAAAETREQLIREAIPLFISDEEIRQFDQNQRLLFLIDGLNEIDHSRTLSEKAKRVVISLVRGGERNAVLATSRTPIPPSFKSTSPFRPTTAEVTLLPFDSGKIQSLISKYPQIDYKDFDKYLQTGKLQSLGSNPQLLSMLITIFLNDPETPAPRSIAELFGLFFNTKWTEKAPLIDQPDIGRHTFQRALSSLAWHSRLYGLQAVTKDQWADLLSPFDNIIQRDGLTRQLIIDRAHTLYLMELKARGLVFIHERFLDYFAACFLEELGELPEFLWYLREWEQSISFLAGLKNDTGLQYLLNECIERRRISLTCQLAAANFGRLKEDEIDNVFRLISSNLYSSRPQRDEAVQGLMEFATFDSIDRLLQTLPDVPMNDRTSIRRAVYLLRQSRLTPAIYQKTRRRDARYQMRPKKPHNIAAQGLRDRDITLLLDSSISIWERRSAAKRLGRSGHRESFEPLVASLKDQDSYVRGAAATALGALGDRAAVEPLVAALKDEISNVRGAAATALGALGDRAAIEPLVAAVKDEAPGVRGSAATALGALGDRAAVEPLVAALKDEAPEVRGSAATALAALGDRAAVEPLVAVLKDEAPEVRGAAGTALGALGDRAAVEPLVAAVKDEAPNVRGSAAMALAALGDRAAVEPLVAVLKDEDPYTRGAAATALGALGDRAAVEPLVAVLKDEDPYTRGAAATALGALGDRAAVEPLVAALKDEAPEVRGSAATALGALGDRAAVEPLVAALKDEDPYTRGAAATALGALGDRAAVEPLVAALKDEISNVRGAAGTALGALGDRAAVEPLVAAVKDEAPEVRAAAATALARFGGDEAMKSLIILCRDADPKVRGVALNASLSVPSRELFDLFLERLRDDTDGINRTIAIMGLGMLGDPEATNAVLEHLRDPDAGARGEAARTLVKLVPYLQAEKAREIISRLIQFWIQCRHPDTASAIYLAIKDLPPRTAEQSLREKNVEAHRVLPAWKLQRWERLRQEIALMVRCQNEIEHTRKEEHIYLEYAWGLNQDPSILGIKPIGILKEQSMIKTVLELDLVGFSSIASILEENAGPQTVAGLIEQIQNFIDQGLSAVGAIRHESVMSTTGDGAIIVFDKADDAHQFAKVVHETTHRYNAGKNEPSAIRLFRMGAASGEITMRPRAGGGYDIAGVTIAKAVRLEAAANPGELVVDIATYTQLPTLLRNFYSEEEQVRGKRNEVFTVRRSVMNAATFQGSTPVSSSVPQEATGDRRAILELFKQLNPQDQLERLMFLLEMPIEQQPSKLLPLSVRKDHILQHLASTPNGLQRLESELHYMIENQNRP